MSVLRLTAFMNRYPVLTASTQAGLLMCSGDLICQTAIEKKRTSDIDLMRTARFGLVGFVVVGPILRKWYGILERNIVIKSPALSAATKMAVDQGVFAPVFLAGFMGFMGRVNGHSQQQVIKDIKRDYADVLISNYQLWPAAQMFNFWVVPIQHRVLFAQTVALAWNTYLSFKTNQPGVGKAGELENSKIKKLSLIQQRDL